ncbi:MAG: site-specific integrase, partial [Rhodospirillaceae bacterium]|nr:site-specific integrase [Rhodospirillaceae bacterium]
AKWFGLPLSMIPANAEFLRQKFKDFHHAQVGTSEHRVRNVRSLLLRAMRTVGLTTKLAPYQSSMSERWRVLYDALPDRYAKTALSRFIRYCSKQGISPDQVDDAIAAAFLAALEQESLVKHPKRDHQTVCRVWNNMAATVDAWPQTTLAAPRYDEGRTYAIGDDQIHPDLVRAIDRYLKFLTGKDLFSSLPKPFRPASIKATAGGIRRYLSALHHNGFDVASLRSLDDMVEFAVFKQAMKWFWDRNGGKTSKHIGEVAWIIRCIAVKHLECDDATACKYREAIGALRVQQTGLSDKNTVSLAQFDDPKVVARFLNYPDQLFSAAKRAKGRQSRLLAQAATGAMILMFAPMRIKNLCDLRIDQSLNWIDNRLHIHVPGHQVKNGVELNFALPPGPSGNIREYIDRYRSMFRPEANPYLFPGRRGPKDQSALRRQISNTLFEHTGIRLTPHQFRHVAAKLLLDARPGHYEVVRKLLGHKNLSTAYDHYTGSETQAAIDLYDKVILERKRGRSGKAEPKDDKPFLDPFNPFLKGARR